MPTLTPFMQSYIIQYCLRWLEADFLLLKKQVFFYFASLPNFLTLILEISAGSQTIPMLCKIQFSAEVFPSVCISSAASLAGGEEYEQAFKEMRGKKSRLTIVL